jgi:hypothetical protein
MKSILVLSILALTAGLSAYAGPTLTVIPSSGSIQGFPGTTVGWGFTLTSDPVDWISVVTSSLLIESDPGLGTYTDFAGLQGGPVNGVLAPNAPDWTETFDPVNMLGLGSYTIGSGFGTDAGLLDLNYETFSADPNTCTNCATGFADLLVAFQVSSVPEPSAVWLVGLALPLLWLRLRRLS